MSDFGLVLAGGAARGAYQVGVMRFVFDELASRLGRPTWPDLVSGTSVGSINGLFAAARTHEGLARLTGLWRDLSIDQVYALHWSSMFGAVRSAYRSEQSFALLDPRPLYKLVRHHFPTTALRHAIDSGACRALVLSATELDTGYNALFVDSGQPDYLLNAAPGATVHRVRIRPKHVLGSAALPMLFPSVRVNGEYFVDGGLRQNTPLRPLLRAGASKALVIGVKRGLVQEGLDPLEDVTPNLPFLLGKTFNAIMLDPVERDIQQAEQINRIVDWGERVYGPPFAAQVDADLGLHRTDIVFLKPSEDLGRIASETFRSRPPRVSTQLGWLLGFIADRANAGESDLLSFLYFDKAFTGALEALGYEDAKRREEQLASLFMSED